jgi:hypothetical protein
MHQKPEFFKPVKVIDIGLILMGIDLEHLHEYDKLRHDLC